MYVNEVTVVGNLCKTPEIVKLKTGNVANMRLAIDKKSTGGEGEEAKRTEYINVEVYGAQADNCANSLKIGNRCIIVGELRYDEWVDGDGSKRSKHKIKANVVGTSLEFSK